MLFYFSRFDPLIYYTVLLGQSQYDRDDADTLPLPHPYYPEEGVSGRHRRRRGIEPHGRLARPTVVGVEVVRRAAAQG